MSQEIDLCHGSDNFDNGELPNTNAASLPPLPQTRKRPRDKEESSNNSSSRNKNSPGKTNATDSAEFVVDPELADEVEVVSPHNKNRRGAMKSAKSNNAAGQRVKATEKGVGSKAAQGVGDDESTNKHSPELSTLKPPANESDRQSKVSAWDIHLSELADYFKIHGHCNVPYNYSENAKLAKWVGRQRSEYKSHLKGKISPMTNFRIQELESLGIEWSCSSTTWEDRLSELADYRKVHGHCNIPTNHGQNIKLANWVGTQRKQYRLHEKGKPSQMTSLRIQAMEGLSFEWDYSGITWEDRLSELADYRKIHGNCNVPYNYSENTKLAKWVTTQRCNYGWLVKGIISPMTTFRIQTLESLGFEWNSHSAAWAVCLNELADYRKIHGHCNVFKSISENTKLANWVGRQKSEYKLLLKGKKSSMTPSRIQELESLDFKWGCSGATREDRASELSNEVEVSPQIKRRGVDVRSKQIVNNCEAGKRAQILKGVGATKKGVGSENAQVADHRESYDGIAVIEAAAAASHPMNADSEQTNRDDGFANKHSQKASTSKPPPHESGQQWRVFAWEGRLSELVEYRKIHGHCNVPQNCSGNIKLANWVTHQRSEYRLHIKGNTSSMTPSRIQALEILGFKWDSLGAALEDRLSKLADYRKIHGHCNVPQHYIENSKLGTWVATQRKQYMLHVKGKPSHMTLSRIQTLESLGFEWNPSISRRKVSPKKPSLDDVSTCVIERALEAPEHVQTAAAQTQEAFSAREIRRNQVDVAFEPKGSDWADEVHLGYMPCRTEEI